MERPFPAYRGDDPYIFVSYAHDDAVLVYSEITRLKEQGFNVWYDEGIGPGHSWRDEIALALTQCKVFLYFITPRSVASSNCLKEVNFCLSRERTILSVYLEQSELPIGLELSLSDTQAIVRNNHSNQAYQQKLTDSLNLLLPLVVEPPITPSSQIVSSMKYSQKSIAILPLANRSNVADNEYLSDGITEELINGLSRVPGLKVASTLSSFACKGLALDVTTVGKKLAVGTVLSGSLQKSDNRIRINVRLDSVEDGTLLWSERYDREIEDIFDLQDDVARSVVDALKVELHAGRSAQLVNVGTQNVQAYDAFLLGVHEYRKFSRKSIDKAVMYLQQAAQIDAGFGRVHWLLFSCYSRLINVFGLPRKEMVSKAEGALDRANEAGFIPPIPWIEATRDLYPETRPDQRGLAFEACEKIRRPEPEWQLHAYWQIGSCLCATGLFHAALDYQDYYFDHAPHDHSDTWMLQTYRYLLSYLGRFDKAIDLWTEAIAAHPNDPMAIGDRAALYSRTGQYEKAEQDLTELNKQFPRNFPQFYHLYWRREIDAAKEYFNWLESSKNLQPAYKYWGCFLLGDFDRGFDHLEEVHNRGEEPGIFRLQVFRLLPQSIRRKVEQDSRFQAILKQSGIDDNWRNELLDMVNELTDVTGIHVKQDEEY